MYGPTLVIAWAGGAALVGALAVGLYSHPVMLAGELCYDDGSTIAKNPVVLGLTPWTEVWRRDYWGQHALSDAKSHKSFRPITTLALRHDYLRAVARDGKTLDAVTTTGFHVVNVALHAAVSVACLPAAFLALGGRQDRDFAPALMASLLFAAHPVHAEAVQNITGRAEELMAVFYLLGFIVYAATMLKTGRESTQSTRLLPTPSQAGAVAAALACTVFSLLSKETGVTLPLLCAWWDFFVAQELSLKHLPLILVRPRGTIGVCDGAIVHGDCPSSTHASNVSWWLMSSEGLVDTEGASCDEASLGSNAETSNPSAGGTAAAAPPTASYPEASNEPGSPPLRDPPTSLNVCRRAAIVTRLHVWGVRTVILAAGTVAITAWRLSLNGTSDTATHTFRYNANRVALEPFNGSVPPHLVVGEDSGVHGLNRALSIAWLWWRYFWHAGVCPRVLNVDWSGSAIPLITTPGADARVLLLAAWLVWAMLGGVAAGCRRFTRPRVLAVAGVYVFPFVLSANVLVAVGTTVAERCAYLPSLGVCMMFALVLSSDYASVPRIDHQSDGRRITRSGGKGRLRFWAPRWLLLVALTTAFSAKCVERSLAWSSNAALWEASHKVNPASAHTCVNFAIHAAQVGTPDALAAGVAALDSVRSLPEVDRVDADEVYTMLALQLRSLGRWWEALEVLAEGWGRLDAMQGALDRGVVLWHMHALDPAVASVPLRRARLLSAQAACLAHVDLAEAARAGVAALRLAPSDPVVLSMAKDLDAYARSGYSRAADRGNSRPDGGAPSSGGTGQGRIFIN